MRFLPALLLIAFPLLAQEQTDEERREEEARRAAEEQRAADERKAALEKDALEKARLERDAYDKRAEALRREAEERSKLGMTGEELKRLLENLRSASEAKRAAAMDELRRVEATLDDVLPYLAEALANVERARATFEVGFPNAGNARTLVVGARGGEAISGTADGTEYTLTSLGAGKYQLTATKRDGEGRAMEEIADKGTMAELQGKYGFLKDLAAVQLRAAPGLVAAPAMVQWGPADPKGRALWTATQAYQAAGGWDGGGKVGVSVCPPSEDLRFHLQLPEGAGYIVQHVVPGSRAEQIGIRRMDILMKLDDELIDSPIQLKKLHEKAGVLEILRRSEAKKIDLSTFPAWEPPEAPAAVDVPAAPAGAGGGVR